MDAFELLKSDHEKVAGLLEKIEGTTERALKTREELFTQLKTELDIHAEVEEQIFYPVWRRPTNLETSRSKLSKSIDS